jgi:outer membrane protein W
VSRRIARLVAVCALVLLPSAARAQATAFRGFAELGATRFNAAQSFSAIFGSSTGIVAGGGIDVVLPRHIFISFDATRFSKDGTRVFVNNGQVFDLHIPTTIRITPLEISAGYRFITSKRQLVPYAGCGIGWHRYQETSQFADASEDVTQTFRGYQLLGGVEYRVNDWFGVAGEARFASVPNALGQDPTGASAQFGETNLGGTTVVVKAVLGK